MQVTAASVEREALRRVPSLLAELLDEPSLEAEPESVTEGQPIRADLVARDTKGRAWVFEVMESSRPGRVAQVADQLKAYAPEDAIPVLVVPFMSKAGASAAEAAGLNWLDLSGNAHIRDENLHVLVRGQPNRFASRGRPASPFAPKSARVTRELLLDPRRWWRQRDLAEATGLDDGHVSRIVRRLDEESLIERRERELRPHDPDLLLDAWADDYRFDRHEIVSAHLSGRGMESARELSRRLHELNVHHAFTGLPAAWALDRFAQFRLATVYVEGDAQEVAERLELRTPSAGGNVQLVIPDDKGVFAGEAIRDGLSCVAPVQVYLDLLHLPERADEAARHLRAEQLIWNGNAR